MLFASSSPLAHSRAEHFDPSGRPVVSIILTGGEVFEPWSEYRDVQSLEIGTQRTKAHSVGLFIDFIAARGAEHYDKAHRHRIFQDFADALVIGTVENGNDPSGLLWLPGNQRTARKAVADVTAFSDWLVEEHGTKPLNPARQATVAEQIAYWRAWKRCSKASLLKHIKATARARKRANVGHVVNVKGHRPALPWSDEPAFPEAMFPKLIQVGFARRPEEAWTTLRDQMITLLLHEGGLRPSEPMHLWFDDLLCDPTDNTLSIVHVYHPTDGLRAFVDPLTGTERHLSRAEVLRLQYDRVALTLNPGKRRVGWKNPLLSDRLEQYFHVFWRSDDAARAFLRLYLAYKDARPAITKHHTDCVAREISNPCL